MNTGQSPTCLLSRIIHIYIYVYTHAILRANRPRVASLRPRASSQLWHVSYHVMLCYVMSCDAMLYIYIYIYTHVHMYINSNHHNNNNDNNNNNAYYHIIPHYTILYHIITYYIISYHITLYNVISYYTISYHMISYHGLTRPGRFLPPHRRRRPTVDSSRHVYVLQM